MAEAPVPARPPVPTPAALRPTAPAAAAPSESPSARFGRVTDDGTVFLTTPDGEVLVGQWAAGPAADGLAFFARKYDDLVVEATLAQQRLLDGRSTPEQATASLQKVREALEARSFVGDITALTALCDSLAAGIESGKERAQAIRAEQRAQASAAREALITEAEALASSTSWRTTNDRYGAIVEEWKTLPHTDRATEQALWKRLSAARAQFDRARRAHFADLDANRKEAVGRKRELIAKAESLSSSTDFASTSRALRGLMDEWKAAPRSSRQDEDKLWKRFKAAQDAFYAKKAEADSAAEESLREHVPAKEALVAEAEALLPISDLGAAKRELRAIQDRWEKAGDIPRADRERLERKLKRVEDAIREHEAERWRRSNPEARARAESTANAFADGLAKLEQRKAAALAKGDAIEVAKIETSIAQTSALLAAAQAAAAEFTA